MLKKHNFRNITFRNKSETINKYLREAGKLSINLKRLNFKNNGDNLWKYIKNVDKMSD